MSNTRGTSFVLVTDQHRLEKVPCVSVPHTSSNRLLLSNQDKGCTPSVAHSLALPLGPALLNLWIGYQVGGGAMGCSGIGVNGHLGSFGEIE